MTCATYHHGLVSVVEEVKSADGTVGRFYQVAYKRAGDLEYRTVRRHANSLHVVCRKAHYHEQGLNLFDVFNLDESLASLAPDQDNLVLQRFAPDINN